MRPLSARERRLVAVGLLVAAVALVWFGIVGPIVGGFAARAAERDRLQATYQRNVRLIAALPVWRAAAEAQRRDAGRFAIVAPSEQLAAEALKARLQQLAKDEGVVLSSIQDLPADAAPGTVKVRADMQANLTQLCDSLRRLETEGSYVVVDYISISADQAVATGRSSPMGVRLELSADYAEGPPRPS